jgi:hypothetical protein
MPRGKKGSTTPTNKIYWPPELDQVIDEYNAETDLDVREHLFKEHLDYPLDKMGENIINRFKFPYINGNFEETKQQVVSFLVMNLSKYKSERAKSFSYFSVIAKNYLILHNNIGYKQERRSLYLSDTGTDLHVPIEEILNLQIPSEEASDDFREFTKLMVAYWDANIYRHFKRKRDADIAQAIIELFRRAETIENFNKKALYLMIREMTDCETNYITKVINKMKSHVMRHLQEYTSDGCITDKENKFFSYTIKE